MQDLASMKYAELRKLAKTAGIKANQKQEKLVLALTKYYEKKESKATKTPVSTPKITSKAPAAQKSQTPVVSVKPRTPLINKTNTPKSTPVSKTIKASINTPKSSPVPVSKPAHNTPKVQIKGTLSSDKVQIKGTPSSDRVKPASRWEKKVFPPVSAARNSNGKLPASPLVKQAAVKRKQDSTPEASQPAKKRRSTFEKAPTPDLMSPKIAEPRKRRSTFEKAPTPTLKSPEVASGSTEKRRSGRLSSSSPAVKEMLGAMRSDMNADEMKNSLMSVLDKNVQEKVAAAPQNNNGIPRFAAFLKNRKIAKPITPGNKDWDKIHKKNFAKFDSIDVYLNKKRKRVEDMSASVKKAKTLLSEVHSAVNKLKAHKTPDTNENKFVKPRKSNPNATTPFKPTVLNTSKLNLNFGAKPTPKTLPRKSPSSMISAAIKKPATETRKSTSSVPHRKSTTTPFKFTAVNNSSLNNTTITSTKKTFDIKASLARPMTWKPHKGKLKPLTSDSKSPVYLKTNSAAKAVKTVNNRATARDMAANRRADKKNQAQMARRGINV